MYTIAITHQKGGVGKTTLTAYLGATYAAQGQRVGLLDLDPQESLRQLPPSGVPVYSIEDEKPEGLDLLIVDTPPYVREEISWLLATASLIVIPMKPSLIDAAAAARTVEILRSQGVRVPTRFVLNMCQHGNLADEIEHMLGGFDVPVCRTRIPQRVGYVRGMLGGLQDQSTIRPIEELAAELAALLPAHVR